MLIINIISNKKSHFKDTILQKFKMREKNDINLFTWEI